MGAMVLSSGRSGTNLMLAMLTNHDFFTPFGPDPEDKACWFDPQYQVPMTYLSKSDTHYILNFDHINQLMTRNGHMKLIWMLRDPRDWAMSKIAHGFERDSYDATFDGVVADMFHMFRLYKQAIKYIPDRMKTVKMEYLLKNPRKELKEVCEFLQINFTEDLLDFNHNLKKKSLKEQYKNLDTSRIGLYRKWKKAYDGYLSQTDIGMNMLFDYLKPMTQYFKYNGA
jgi:hypothetical protein